MIRACNYNCNNVEIGCYILTILTKENSALKKKYWA